NSLIKEKRLDETAKLNKRLLTYVDEAQQSKKRAKDNFYIVQSKNPWDNSEVDISQSHKVTEDKLPKKVDEGYAEGENFSNDELGYNEIRELYEVKKEIIIIEDSDDDLPPLNDEVICISSDDEEVIYDAYYVASAASRSH